MFHELILYTNYVNTFTYLGGRIRHDNGGRGHSYAYSIYLTYRCPRINAAPNKGDPAFTQRIIKKNLYDLVIYTIQTITILSWQKKSIALEL